MAFFGGGARWPSAFDASDFVVALVLASLGAWISAWGQAQFDPALYTDAGWDIYFQADTPRVFENLTQFDSERRSRDTVHPLFSLLAYPPVAVMMRIGLAPFTAASVAIAFVSGLTAATFYVAMRRLALPIGASVIYSGMLLSSAAFIHWSTLIETYAFSALSITVMLAVLLSTKQIPLIGWILASALTMSVTVTNWMLGLAAAFFKLPLRHAAFVSATALGLVAVLAVGQRAIFPTSETFLSSEAIASEWQWTQIAQQGYENWNPLDSVRSFFLITVTAPDHVATEKPPGGITNGGLTWRALLPVAIPTFLWLALLAAGAWGFTASRSLWPQGAALAAFIFGQVVLHSLYGEITFTYALHYAPILVAMAAGAYFAPGRRFWLGFAMLLILINGAGNIQRFKQATAAINATLASRS